MSPPALTPRIWGILLRNELFKARKRLAFWLALGFFAFVNLMNFGSEYWDARNDPEETFALPEAWSSVLTQDTSVSLLIFGCVSLILLASSEFSWRTARQNVIDGLSKNQWFWGKSMLVPVLGLLYVGVAVALGGGFAVLGTDPASASGPLVPVGVWKAAGALFLCFLAIGSLALFLAFAIRSTGGTMAVWFLWILPVEQLILPGVLGRIFPGLRSYFQYQPFTLATRLGEYEWYDPAAWDRLVAAREAADATVPTPPDISTGILVTAGWTIVFLTLAYVTFRRRDL